MHSAYPPRVSLKFPPPLPLPSTPPLSFSREVNKKLSYRRQNAFSIIKIYERRNTKVSANIYYFCASASLEMAGDIMFSTCPFVRPFVCPLPNCSERCLKTNELAQGCSRGKGVNGRPRGSGCERSRSQIEAEVIFGSLVYIILDRLSRVDRGIHVSDGNVAV